MHRTATSARREAEEIRELLKGSVKDARSLKTLTFIALIYLPASLVAVNIHIFSYSRKQAHFHKYLWHPYHICGELQLMLIVSCQPYSQSSIRIWYLLTQTVMPVPRAKISPSPRVYGYISFSRRCLRRLRLVQQSVGRVSAILQLGAGFPIRFVAEGSDRDYCLILLHSILLGYAA